MGTQQILLIVLGIIIIGIAVAVGISLSQQNIIRANRQALFSDLDHIQAHAMAFYRAPVSIGGGGRHWIPFLPGGGGADHTKGDQLGKWLGYEDYEESPQGDRFTTNNGVFWMNLSSWEGDDLTIIASGNENGNDPDYESIGHGETGCVEVRMVLTGSTGNVVYDVLN